MSRMKFWGAALMAAAALLAAPALAGDRESAANTDYQGQVRGYLTQQSGKIAAEGFRPDGSIPDLIRPLRLDGGVVWSIPLRVGVTYRVFAVCDNDCSDLDMELYDSSGLFVGRDVGTSDAPYVEFTPAANGAAFARIWLAACEHEPCYVGARVFRR